MDAFSRTRMLLGSEAMDRLARAHVAVFGVGGVGGATVEALARAGIGQLTLIDNDTVSLSNINRQLIATHDTLGMAKVEAARARVLSINPDCRVNALPLFYRADELDAVDLQSFDYIVDAIDTVSAKIALIVRAKELGVQIISSMGTGNKLDPTRFELADISKTSVCPLARVMRKELRARGVASLQVLYSKEDPITPHPDGEAPPSGKRQVPGSVSFVPPVAGFVLAGAVIRAISER